MGWSADIREVWVASLAGRPRDGGGRFRLPWLGGVGCSWGSAFLWLWCMYVTLNSGACVPYDTIPMFVRWCANIILIQARYLNSKTGDLFPRGALDLNLGGGGGKGK